MTTAQLAGPGTRFGDLATGNIVRIPPARGTLTAIVVMAPVAKVTSAPSACPRCPALLVTAEDVATGAEVTFHRLPDRPVIVINPSTEA